MNRIFLFLFLGGAIATPSAMIAENFEQDRLVKRSLEVWEQELASSIVSEQMFMVDRIVNSLKTEVIERISITKDDKNFFSIPSMAEIGTCKFSSGKDIYRYNRRVARLEYCKSVRNLFVLAIESTFFWFLLSGFIALSLVVQILSLRGYRSSLLNVLDYLRNWAESDLSRKQLETELLGQKDDPLAQQLIGLVSEGTAVRLELLKVKGDLEKNELMAIVASQVAHDIRSPLSALDMVLKDLGNMPEDKRILVRTATQRIKDIANNLIEKNRSRKLGLCTIDGSNLNQVPTVHLISNVLDSIVSEKRTQFRNRPSVEIDLLVDEQSYGLFAIVNLCELKRIISNLINNSVEALGDSGFVRVQIISPDSRCLKIQVRDNGKGVPSHILAQFGERGVSHKKADTESGSGLGIPHAKSTIEGWGGKFEAESTVGKGTTVSLMLPCADAPKWFVKKLEIVEKSKIVILDDDVSIHQVWEGRFHSSAPSAELIHFSSPKDLCEWVTKNQADKYLVDYELLGNKDTGLDVIEKLGLEKEAILVTSRFEESEIQARCAMLKVGLIPKGLAPIIKIVESKAKQRVDAIVIDDDPIIHMTWQVVANERGLNIQGFSNPQDFFARQDEIDPESTIYIDSKLGGGIKGEDISKKIFANGFESIYLMTGCDPSSFPPMDHIKKVIGKDFPF